MTTLTNSSRRLIIGFNITAGNLAIEIGDGSQIKNYQWACGLGRTTISPLNCEGEFASHRLHPTSAPLPPRVMSPGWWQVSPAFGFDGDVAQTTDVMIDGRLNALRADTTFSLMPFTGSTRVSVSDPEYSGIRGPSYVLGRCVDESGQLGTVVVPSFAPNPSLFVTRGTSSTSGAYPGNPPGAPELGPAGPVTVRLEGCVLQC